MIYYIYKFEFQNTEGKQVTVTQHASCEDFDYDVNLVNTKNIVYEQAKALNDNQDINSYIDSVETIIQQEYVDFFNGDIPENT